MGLANTGSEGRASPLASNSFLLSHTGRATRLMDFLGNTPASAGKSQACHDGADFFVHEVGELCCWCGLSISGSHASDYSIEKKFVEWVALLL